MPHYKLTYPDLRASGEVIRLMFALAGVDYEDVRLPVPTSDYTFKDAPVNELKFGKHYLILRDFAKEHVLRKLCSSRHALSRIPVLEVDGVKIGQTLAILRYLAKEFGFAGPDNLTCALADAQCDQYADFVLSFMPWHMRNKGFVESDKKTVNEQYENNFLPTRAKNFAFFEEALRKSSTGWFVNTPDVTHADVFIAVSIEYLLALVPKTSELLDGFPLLKAHQKKFFAHPKLQEYLTQRSPADY